MSEQGNQNFQDAKSALSKGGRAAKTGIKGGVKAGKAVGKGAGKAITALPPHVIAIIAGVLIFILLILSIVEGLNSVQMDNNEYRTAVKEEAKNVPADEEAEYDANYNLGLALKQTLDLSDVIHEAKQKEKEKIEGQYSGKKVVCQSDQTPVLINEDYPEYNPSIQASVASGGVSSSAQDVINGACAWAEAIAADNSFHYGACGVSGIDHGRGCSHRNGCYFCKTNNGKSKNMVGRDKTYCCNAFVFSAFAHGGGDPKMLESCKKGGNAKTGVFNDGKTFKRVGKISKSSLQKGDVLEYPGHYALYIGDGKIAEAVHRDNNKNGSDNWNDSIHIAKVRSGYSAVDRYIGKGGGPMENPSGTVTATGAVMGNSFQAGVVKWAKDTVALRKYKYKVFENAPANGSKCPICHPGSGNGWNCIGFAWASWKHGGNIDSSCWCGVIDNGMGDRMFNMSAEEAAKAVEKKAGVPVQIIKNGGSFIPESMLQPGDLLMFYNGSTYAHMAVYIGNSQYAESSSPGAYVGISTYGKGFSKSVKIAIRYKGAGGGGVTFSKKDSFTVLDEITPSTGTRYSIGYVGSSNCAQSFAYTGDGFAVTFVTSNHAPSHIQLYDKKGKALSSQRADEIGHANASCMTAEGDLIVGGVKHLSSTSAYKYNVKGGVSGGESVSLPSAAFSLAYDRETEKHILATSASFKVYGKSMSGDSETFSRNMHSASFCQDIGAANGYIFACQTTVKGGETYGKNYVDIYNETNGDYCGSYYIKYGELESVDVVDGELVLLIHILGHVNYIHYTGINVGSAQGGGITNYTTKHDLDVLSAYSVTLSNTGLFKTEETKDGENRTWLDKLASGDIGTDNYTDLKGNRLKLYWFGEKRGRVNYKSDLKKKLGEGWFRRKKVYFYEVIKGQKALDAMEEDGVDPNASPMGVSGGAQAAVDWAKKIAADNSFTYGSFARRRAGCYFCGTRSDKHYSCMPFVTAAYAHGANDPDVLALCERKHAFSTWFDDDWKDLIDKGKFKEVGKAKDLSFSDLQVGDIFVTYAADDQSGHQAMYAGGNDIVEAAIPGEGANSIQVDEGAAKSAFARLQRNGNNFVMRYTGQGGPSYASASTDPGDVIYLRERPVSDILEDMDMDPEETYSGSGRKSMFDATNLEAAIGMSDNTENMLYTGYMNVVRTGAASLANLGTGDFGMPIEKGKYTITSHVGKRDAPTAGASTNHPGVDMACPTGTPVYASLSGTVTVARKTDQGGYGLYVQIASGDYEIIYAHLSKVLVNDGDTITKGQNIGLVGSTGTSTGPHLHFEVHKNGKVIDPEEFMNL